MINVTCCSDCTLQTIYIFIHNLIMSEDLWDSWYIGLPNKCMIIIKHNQQYWELSGRLEIPLEFVNFSWQLKTT